jgi:hypothetical protein
VKLQRLAIEPIVISPLPNSLQTYFWIKVEEECKVWLQSLGCESVSLIEEFDLNPSCISLVNHRGVSVPVAKDHGALGKGWSDDFLDMIRPVRKKKE